MKELESSNFYEVNKVVNGNHFIKITTDGKTFLQTSSSFLREIQSYSKKQIWMTTKQTILITETIVLIIGIGFAIYFGKINDEKNIIIGKLDFENITLKNENKLLRDSLTLKTIFKATENKTTKQQNNSRIALAYRHCMANVQFEGFATALILSFHDSESSRKLPNSHSLSR